MDDRQQQTSWGFAHRPASIFKGREKMLKKIVINQQDSLPNERAKGDGGVRNRASNKGMERGNGPLIHDTSMYICLHVFIMFK